MTTASASQPITLGGLLFSDSGIASVLEVSGTADVVRDKLANFAPATRNEAVQEVERISNEMLDLSLTDVLLSALLTYEELRAAGRRTIAKPDSEEIVELVSHRITLDDQPSIDLLVNGAHVASVHLLLSLVIDIQVLTAVIREGCLTALQIGRCDVNASVGIEGTVVASRRAQLQLPVSLPMGRGLPLVAVPPPRGSALGHQPGR